MTAQAQQRYRERNPEKVREGIRRWRAAHLNEAREGRRRERAVHRDAIFQHYGTSCACCGTTERLEIDHINGGGTEHRKKVGGGSAMYYWLVKNGFPAGFQALCMPCNRSKRGGERCRLNHSEVK